MCCWGSAEGYSMRPDLEGLPYAEARIDCGSWEMGKPACSNLEVSF